MMISLTGWSVMNWVSLKSRVNKQEWKHNYVWSFFRHLIRECVRGDPLGIYENVRFFNVTKITWQITWHRATKSLLIGSVARLDYPKISMLERVFVMKIVGHCQWPITCITLILLNRRVLDFSHCKLMKLNGSPSVAVLSGSAQNLFTC